MTDGLACDDGNACTVSATCQDGVCTAESSVECPPPEECHDPGVCDPATGICSNPNTANGATCTGDGVCCNGFCYTGCCGDDGSCESCLTFVTSTTHNGNLGGLSGADQICQDLAENAPTPLPGSYKAWLSTGTGANESPSTRFRQSALGYVRVDGVTVANSWDDLTDGSIDNAINVMEDGVTAPPPSGNISIWTNTEADGDEDSDQPFDCDNWTSSDNALTGKLGMADPNETDEDWTDLGSVQFCDSENVRLYCFQQD